MFSKLFGRSEGNQGSSLDEEERRRSPALDEAIAYGEAHQPEDGGLTLLDLGAAHGTSLESFGRRGHRIHVCDLLGGLRRDGGGLGPDLATPEVFGPRTEELLPDLKTPKFHIGLLWDLLDYLPPETFPTLFQLLAQRMDEGSHLIIQVGYQRKMPAQPRMQEVMEDLSLRVQSGEPQISCPRHRETQIGRSATPFRVERSFLCKNGLMEYLMVRGS
ncbi:MAG: hypothetical protein AAGD01_16790 [Acidobacteriota bacterium]